MTDPTLPSPEEIVLYSKDPATKIATITFDRPDQLNAPRSGRASATRGCSTRPTSTTT
jgi:hypothetical protein